ncbi:hypothetical protein BH23ACT2_BH23ACT2_20440 [soil metagenome]
MRQELGSAAEIAGLAGFAVVQPVLGPFGESPETFVALGATPTDIVVFALSVAVAPVLVFAVAAASTRVIGHGVRAAVQTGLVAVLGALAAVVLARSAGLGDTVRVLVGVTVLVVVALVHRRWAPGRLFLRYASPTPVLLVAAFLFASPVAPLVRPPEATVAAGASGSEPSVVFIVLDELPTLSLVGADGAIDANLFPNAARLADTSTWYLNHTTVAPDTEVAVPALITGRLPEPDDDPPPASHVEHPESIFSLLAPTHRLHAVEWATDLCPPGLCADDTMELDDDASALLSAPVADRAGSLDRLFGEARSTWWQQAWPTADPASAAYTVAGATTADELARPGLEFLSGLIDNGPGPVLDYLHVPVPHQPWRLLPSGEAYGAPHPPVGAEFLGWGDGDAAEQYRTAGRSRHLLQMQWTDRLLGAIFDRLDELGRWDDSVIVLTADHGVSFEPDTSLRALSPKNQVDISWSPLLIKAPGQQGPEVVRDNALSVDVLPTVADLLDVEVGWDTDGVSLLGAGRTDPAKPSHAAEPERFEARRADGLVELDADGLAAIESRPGSGSFDELAAWRHGRHGRLIGTRVSDLGVCEQTGPEVTYSPPEAWDDFTDGSLDPAEPLPLWHEATVAADDPIDVAAVVDGEIVSWALSRRANEGTTVGLLLTAPLVAGTDAVPTLYQVMADGECRLRPLR